jgi:FkbM family methyltransferase
MPALHLGRRVLRPLGYAKTDRNRCLNQREALLRLLPMQQVKTIFDVGANFGQSAVGFRKAYPNATIYSFEPFEGAYSTLCETVADDSNVKTFQLALSNEPGETTFYINNSDANHSLLPQDSDGHIWADIDHVDQQTLRAESIDNFCNANGIDHIDLLKVDTEGGDLKVLEGAQELLRQQKIDVVYVEILFVPIFAGQGAFHEVCAHMDSLGYNLFDLFDHRYAKDGRLKLSNALFVSPKILK